MIDSKTLNKFACRLAAQPAFSCSDSAEVPEEGLYSFYTSVPVNDIYRDDETIAIDTPADGTAYPVLDLLICQGNRILLAVIFGENDRRANSWFGHDGILHGMHLVVLPSRTSPLAKLEEFYQMIRPEIQMIESIWALEAEYSNFTLDTSPLQEVIPQDAPGKLQQCELLAADGTITPEGSAYGLFQGVGEGFTSAYFLAEHAVRTFLNRVFEVPSLDSYGNRPVSLQTRLARINSGSPGDDLLVQHIVTDLQHLLAMPLEEYYRLSWKPPFPATTEYDALQKQISEAKHHLPASSQTSLQQMTIQTFGDVLHLVWNLYENTTLGTAPYFDVEDLCRGLLVSLCTPAVAHGFQQEGADPRSLAQRLHPVSDRLPLYKALDLPIRHYIYGACILQQSAYPDWIYRNELCGYMYNRPMQESDYTPLEFIRIAQGLCSFYDSSNLSEGFYLLYVLLVKPLVVDCNSADTMQTDRPQCKFYGL